MKNGAEDEGIGGDMGLRKKMCVTGRVDRHFKVANKLLFGKNPNTAWILFRK